MYASTKYMYMYMYLKIVFYVQEFWCIIHGFLYFLAIPSMSMLLMLYSLGNLHVVSWGTREAPKPAGMTMWYRAKIRPFRNLCTTAFELRSLFYYTILYYIL